MLSVDSAVRHAKPRISGIVRARASGRGASFRRRAFASHEVEWSTIIMPKLSRIRTEKMIAQDGRCFYCDLPMWDKTVSRATRTANKLTRHLPQILCTAEHLRPRSEGGDDTPSNIVAACLYCNQARHRAKRPRSPEHIALMLVSAWRRGDGSRPFFAHTSVSALSRIPRVS